MKNYTAIIALALSLPAGFATAQQPDGRPPGPPTGESRPPIERPFGGTDRAEKPHPPHVPPFFAALDKNGDGVISEDEIAASAESLRKLAAEHGGKLTIETLLGPPPQGMRREGFRPPGASPNGQQPRGNFKGPQDNQRADARPRRFAPPQGAPDGPREPRGEAGGTPRDGARPEGRGPKDGERPPGEFRPREGVHPDGAPRPEGRGPRDVEAPREAAPLRDGEQPRKADRPRDGGPRPEGDRPRPDRPPGDAPKPDGDRPPNPEG